MATEPIQGGPYPVPGDSPDGPSQMKAINDWAAVRLNMRFASVAARDAAIPTPVAGMECVIGAGAGLVKYIYDGTAWRTFYEDTGWVNCTSVAGFNASGLQVRRDRKRVELQGVVRPTGTGSIAAAVTNIAQVPAGFRRTLAGEYGGGVVASTANGFNFVWLLTADGFIQIRNLGASLSYTASTALAPPSGWYVD